LNLPITTGRAPTRLHRYVFVIVLLILGLAIGPRSQPPVLARDEDAAAGSPGAPPPLLAHLDEDSMSVEPTSTVQPGASGVAPGATVPTPTRRANLLCGAADGSPCALSLLAIEPDFGVDPLIVRFNEAMTSIEYMPFELDDPDIIQALALAQERGVRVRVLVEPEPSDDRSVGRKTMRALQDAGVEARYTNPTYELTHAKFAVIDHASVVLTTSNSTSEALPGIATSCSWT